MSSSGEDYGSMQGSFVDDIDSDFGEDVVEYDVDENGNPINAKSKVTKGDPIGKKLPQDKEVKDENPEARKKRKRLEKLDKKISTLGKKHEREGVVKMLHPSDIKNKHKR